MRACLNAISSAVAVLAMAVSAGCGDDDGGDSRDPVSPALGDWHTLPKAPVGADEGFQNLRGAEVNGQVLVVAGSTFRADAVEGVALDLRTRTWERLPAAPLRWRAGYTLAEAGTAALIWGGASNTGSLADGAKWDSGDGRWQRVAAAPLRGRAFHTAVWTGRRMIVWGGRSEDGMPLGDGASYNAARDRWRRLPAAPLRGRGNHTAVWTGTRMLVWGGDVTRRRRRGFVSSGAAYDPEADRWKPIARAPIRATEGADAVWTGRRMLVVTDTEAASYDPAADRWRRLPDAPLVFDGGTQTAVWSAGQMLVWGGGTALGAPGCVRPADGVAYSPRSESWRCMPRSPLAARDRHAAIPLASGMVVWGGCCVAGRSYWADDGAIYESQQVRRPVGS